MKQDSFSIFAPMKQVYNYYTQNIETYSRALKALQHKIHLMGSIRLALAACVFLNLWIFRDENWQWLTITTFVIIIPFAFLMWLHGKLYAKKVYTETLIQLNKDERKGLDYDFSSFDGAKEKISGDHPFSLDLDIFGDHSLFQSINRTITSFGKDQLANSFINPLTDRHAILDKQEAIKELKNLTDLRQHFFVTGSVTKDERNNEKSEIHSMLNLTATYKQFTNKPSWKLLSWLIPAIWSILGFAYLNNFVAGNILNIFFIISVFIAYYKTKEINKLYDKVNKMEHLFNKYAQLIAIIESNEFQSKELKEIQGLFHNEKEAASSAIKRLSSYIGGLDQRFSLAGIIFNILYLRDIRHAMRLDGWIESYANKLPLWFDALSRFDALCSLGGFAFNHPNYIYPEITDSYFKMEGKDLGHPLLNRDVCVKNDINIHKSPWFLIITGANMAGKSTYLRTVGTNYLLACVGAPVCASSLTIYPAHLVTSLRTSDSLASNESYFFAELKRLKMIIDRLQSGEKLFIILDEILKGTNSIDKQKGSLALMKQLIAKQTCGIIATHDLVLGTLEKEFPQQIKNYRFEADIQNEELTFSYQLREGIAQNMNACFLMRKMGIYLEED